MNSIMEEVNKIVESKEDIRDKTSKILELDFSDSDIDVLLKLLLICTKMLMMKSIYLKKKL